MSLVTWNRIEVAIDTDSVELGLRASIADPLWLLGRQWQIGELTAEDGGTPVSATVTSTSFPIDRLMVGSSVRTLDGGLALEALVEPEPPSPPDLRMRLRAGELLSAQLGRAGFGVAAAALRTRFAPPVATDRVGAALLRGLGARALDADAVVAAVDVAGADQLATELDAQHPAEIATLVSAWAVWYRARIGRSAPSAWDDERGSYRFSLAANVDGQDVHLVADRYRGGTLDWSDLSAVATGSASPTTAAPQVRTDVVLPTPVEYAGGPARRLFELEHANVSFGAIAGAPVDLATSLLVEMALVFSGTWFVIPVPMPASALGRIDGVAVTDTFGEVTQLGRRIRSPGWRMFEVGDGALADLLALIPTITHSITGPAIEQLSLRRDEQANVLWAIEDTVADALGLPTTVEHARGSRPAAGAAWSYVPMTAPPESWFPLVRRDRRFVGATLRPAPSSATPRGALLAGWPAVGHLATDVTSDGLRLARHWQMTRARGGEHAIWVSRLERTGPGPAASGTAADQLVPPADVTSA